MWSLWRRVEFGFMTQSIGESYDRATAALGDFGLWKDYEEGVDSGDQGFPHRNAGGAGEPGWGYGEGLVRRVWGAEGAWVL